MHRFDISSSGAAIRFNWLVDDVHRRPQATVVVAAEKRGTLPDVPEEPVTPVDGAIKSSRRRALVITRTRSHRAFVAEALNAFEPGFDVVTATDTDQAAEWTVAFLPDLIVVDSEEPGAATFVEGIASRRPDGACSVIWIGAALIPDEDARGAQAVVRRDVGLAELLKTIRTLWYG